MNLNFAEIIAALGVGAAFRIANSARASAAYLFNTLLPEEPQSTYSVESGNMTIRAVMAGLVGMDSPYPPGGIVDASTFLEQSAKIANEVTLPEAALRRLQDLLMRLQASGGNTNEAMVQEVLNFTQLVVVQPHLDVMEWLRGQALVNGNIDWTFNKKRLNVNYGIPANHFLTTRTIAGGDAYDQPGSVFWSDIRELRRRVRNVRAFIVHPDTLDVIRYNPAHAMATIAESNGQVTFRRFARDETGAAQPGIFSQDVSETVTLVSYDREGEIINPADPNSTLVLPFMQRGKILAVGNNQSDGYRVGMGSQEDDPNAANRLGYTHIAPTVEGGGRPGRWSDVFTPPDRPWQLVGRGVTNGLPVIEAVDKVAVATTEMPA